jgi:hypothetical protein
MNKEGIILAYMAGVLDGDGSFSLMKKPRRKESHSPIYYPLIQIANASKYLIDFVHKEFLGLIHVRKAYIAKDGCERKISYQWKLEKSTSCLPFLNKIIPYLVIKKERAEFLRNYILKNPPNRGSKKISEEILQDRESDYFKMRSFNDHRSSTCSFSKQCKKNNDNTGFWAYLAGLFDTDGSFSVKKETKDKRMINPKYTAAILLSMTDIRGINKIIENCPFGKYFVVKSRSCLKGMCYRFGIYSKEQCIPFLKNIIPYLKIKMDQAKMLLEFCNKFDHTFYPRNGIPEEELEFRESCYVKIKQLNMGSINLS